MNPRDRIIAYLSTQRSRIESSTVDNVVKDVKLSVFYGMSPISDADIRTIVVQWATFNAVGLLTKQGDPDPSSNPGTPSPGPAPTNSDSDFKDAVNQAIKIAHSIPILVQDVKIPGNIKVSVTGATKSLKSPAGEVGISVSWTGTVKLNVDSGPFHFEGSVSDSSWGLTLSMPRKTYVPDMSKYGQVFSKGLTAAGQIVDATRSFNNISDVKNVVSLITPHVSDAVTAVQEVSAIAKTPTEGGASFGFSVGSPTPGPGETGIPGGVQFQVVFTYVFGSKR